MLVEEGAKLYIASGVKIRKSKILVRRNNIVTIKGNTSITNSKLVFEDTHKIENHIIKENNIIEDCVISIKGKLNVCKNNYMKKVILPVDGCVVVGEKNRFRENKIWVRFGGEFSCGSYNTINEKTEIRCDETVSIGDYNQISYENVIWDTNTHKFRNRDERRIIMKDFEGWELEKPNTNPVIIGNDCWLGRRVSILKGTKIGNECVIGFGTTIAGKTIEAKSVVTQLLDLRINTNVK